MSDGYPTRALNCGAQALTGRTAGSERVDHCAISNLLPHNESLFQKVNFRAGGDRVHQHRAEPRMKSSRWFPWVFLPPTLVASSYGMNFQVCMGLKVELWLSGRDYLYDSGGACAVSVLAARTGCRH
ncbi:hypothetical protein KCP75_21020 [Salmonella enterica subsp. enterica]|nr:hypothetical protein KCP75_21020 [Salmonella enterica subsp. enterica]